ncbi:hypothetical protein VKI21_12145 [Cyanobacterium aponinum UTEX 3222]|uniref:hypothetical protein n=1 Tax=Cyanobacterium aponinum TaxID=379064 RepID=UPI002B4C1ED3|nr:hypothetical protein [Cyanobacterium aponinum]WRL38874.1 hypothetical protein VKI22_01910 [Cyanobacterium aponinum UTEX 3221]WRL40815.1 hypothetical protein VKI21_12145 [Cyanobacterium aponinum UTEX 3222]
MSYSSDNSSHSNSQQLSLFESTSIYEVNKKPLKADFVMSESFLSQWKKRILNYQESQRNNNINQVNFNEELSLNIDAKNSDLSIIESLDPFSLKTHTDQFYNLPEYALSESCLYFILDTHLNLLLYVGETKLSPYHRWMNHDCKSYIQSYIELHRKYKIPVLIRSAFCWGVPTSRKVRQFLEKQLIIKWRSPFNKESWQYWGQPFK